MKTFKEKVQAMSSKEIIMAMVTGLRKPHTKISMSSYGTISTEPVFFNLIKKDVCVGCAATQTICEIVGIKKLKIKRPEKEDYDSNSFDLRAKAYKINRGEFSFLARFERAIDDLRQGKVFSYNMKAEDLQIAKIVYEFELPYLSNDYTENELKAYEKLANLQPSNSRS